MSTEIKSDNLICSTSYLPLLKISILLTFGVTYKEKQTEALQFLVISPFPFTCHPSLSRRASQLFMFRTIFCNILQWTPAHLPKKSQAKTKTKCCLYEMSRLGNSTGTESTLNGYIELGRECVWSVEIGNQK